MIEPRLFLCSGASIEDSSGESDGRKIVALDALGNHANVTLKVEDVARVFLRQLSPRLVDLLEIAAYVFTGDAGTRRGSAWQSAAIEPWSRDLKFVLPVRDLAFWNRQAVHELLVRTLQFLSDDHFSFIFVSLRQDRPFQQYLELSLQEQWAFRGASRVLLFSGGLDSLAGAVETAASGGNVVVVSHRSVTTMSSRQRKLFQELREAFPTVQMLHIPVWLNKHMQLGQEPSQRTRSFWYAALGTVVASSIEAEGVRFFENGVVSLNLPVAGEALRARASRTTHPEALRGFARLFSMVLERELIFDNPFLLKTKADIVSTIVDHGAGNLIGLTVSCAHPMFKSKSQQHCGMCSQCIDRRLAIVAAGATEMDPANDYERDVFLGERRDGYERNMGVNYARHAAELSSMSEAGFAQQFSLELTRAVRDSSHSGDMAQQIIETHKRHAETVCQVLQAEIERNAAGLVAGSLEPSCLLRLVAGGEHSAPTWERYADRIVRLLQEALPRACKTHAPRDEPHLQEICDAILAGDDEVLVREFPFLRWSSGLTKPDWSAEQLGMWIELKYIRKKTDIRPISEAIAADITKYGDNSRRTLFVVYDPKHLIVDERSFAAEIVAHEGMRVAFIR